MTDEQAALIAKAAESGAAGQYLAERGYFDFAASRADYAMLYLAEALLLQDGLAFSSHAAVISEFGRLFAKTGRVPQELHRALIRAQEARMIGDYSASRHIPEDEAIEHLSAAETFMSAALIALGAPDAPPTP